MPDVVDSPTLGADGTIYVTSNGGLFAINPNGTKKWVFNAGAPGNSSAAVAPDGTIYCAGVYGFYSDPVLYAIQPDGTPKGGVYTNYLVRSSPALGADGTIYVGSDKLYAFKPDGSSKWTFPTTWGVMRSTPALGADGTIYVGSSDGNLYAVKPDGTQKWAFNAQGDVASSPVLGRDGTVYVGSMDTNLYAVYGNSPGLAKSSWPMFHHDLSHTGRFGAPINPIRFIPGNFLLLLGK